MDEDDVCSNCIFGKRVGSDTYECHRFPPPAQPINGRRWPLMGADEQCGEHKSLPGWTVS